MTQLTLPQIRIQGRVEARSSPAKTWARYQRSLRSAGRLSERAVQRLVRSAGEPSLPPYTAAAIRKMARVKTARGGCSQRPAGRRRAASGLHRPAGYRSGQRSPPEVRGHCPGRGIRWKRNTHQMADLSQCDGRRMTYREGVCPV